MIDYTLLVDFLIAEAIVLLLLVTLIISHRFIRLSLDKREMWLKDAISNHYLVLIEQKKPFIKSEHPKHGSKVKFVLKVVEDFNGHISGEDWYNLRNQIVDHVLINKARKYATSLFWLRRNYAARVFALHAHPEDEPLILKLLEDKKFLVRNAAMFAAIFLESQKGVEKIFELMLSDLGFGEYVYRDALIKGSEKVFGYIVECFKNPKYHRDALIILASKSWGRQIPLLEDDLNCPDPYIKSLALKVLLKNPVADTSGYFERAVNDADARVRTLGMRGLALYPSDLSLPLLEKGLSDSSWDVRFQAGKSLKRMGGPALDILNRQQEGLAKETAQYVIMFG